MRNSQGVYLVETLVALLVGSLMMLALAALYLQTLRATTTASNQFLAEQIGQSILEDARSSISTLPSGDYPYVPSSFKGTVVITQTPTADGSVFVSAQISWIDPQTARQRTSVYSTVAQTPP